MKIRKANIKDLKRIAELFRKEYRKPPYNEKWTDERALKKVKGYYKNNIIFVVENDKKVQGFLIGNIYLFGSGTKGFIDEIVVNSEYQGKGFGGGLMDYFENYLKKKKIKRVGLMSSTKSKAFKIYKKKGFKVEKNFVPMNKDIK